MHSPPEEIAYDYFGYFCFCSGALFVNIMFYFLAQYIYISGKKAIGLRVQEREVKL